MTWEPKNKLDDEDVDVSDDEDKDNSFNREDKSGLLFLLLAPPLSGTMGQGDLNTRALSPPS